MQLKIKNKSEKQKKQIKNNWKTETQQKTQKMKKNNLHVFPVFPNVQQISQVIPSISAFCSQVPFFVYYLFISCIFVFLSSHLLFVCCLLFDHFLCWVFVFQLCLFCFFFVFLICVLFSVFFWWVFICCFFNFFSESALLWAFWIT